MLPMLVMLLLGMFDYGKYMYVSVMATEAARMGARQLSQTAVGDCSQTTAVTAAIAVAQGNSGAAKQFMNQIGLQSQTTVTATCQALAAPANPTWKVALRVDYQPTIGFLTARSLMPKGTGTTARVNATLQMRGR